MMKFLKKAPLAAGVAMAMVSGGAQAQFNGIDVNLSVNPAAGGMGGAAYTKPEEVSAAVFGNPATLTQFKGFNMNFGAAFARVHASNEQTFAGPTGTFTNKSISDADNYLAPNFGVSLEIAPGMVFAIGFEADSAIGADYRDDPLMLVGGAAPSLGFTTPITLPLIVELLSFNANLGLGYEVTDKLSVGVSGTVAFGMVQLGTTGPTTGITEFGVATGNPGLTDFGGTTSSVHDIGFGASIGATYALSDKIMFSGTVKTPTEYNFRKAIHSTVPAAFGKDAWQSLRVETPLEVIAGVALEDLFIPNLLVEADVSWKNWESAATLEDVWEDQFMVALGGRYTMDKWIFRAGYQWSEPLSKKSHGNTLNGLCGLGSIPLGACADAAGFGAVANDVISIVQTSLLPVLMEHTFSVGIGYNFTDSVRVDGYAQFSPAEELKRNTPNLEALAGLPATEFKGDVDVVLMGIGINVAMP